MAETAMITLIGFSCMAALVAMDIFILGRAEAKLFHKLKINNNGK
jgi:hypothetical protein